MASEIANPSEAILSFLGWMVLHPAIPALWMVNGNENKKQIQQGLLYKMNLFL
jgi:hypothetical protein